MFKQVVTVLRHKGARIAEANIRDVLGPKWSWKVRQLVESVQFIVGDWQAEAVRAVIEAHNLRVEERWIAKGGATRPDCAGGMSPKSPWTTLAGRQNRMNSGENWREQSDGRR